MDNRKLFKIMTLTGISLCFFTFSANAKSNYTYTDSTPQYQYNQNSYGYNQGDYDYNQDYNYNQNAYNGGYGGQNQYNSNLQGYALYVPAGVTTTAILSQEIDSQSAVVGQTVNAILSGDFYYNGTLIASEGSVVVGSVVQNKKAGFGNRNAKMQIRFTTIRTPYNNIIPISAVIATTDSTGILKGGATSDSVKDYTKKTVIGAGSGAALGTAMGALSSGSVGKGAVYGTALGAGIGLLAGAADKGENVSIPANSQINLLFDQPITLNAQ